MKRSFFILYIFMSTIPINAKVLFITHNYNRPELIEMQSKTLKHFVQNEFELQVYDDSIDKNITKKMHEVCLNCNVTYVRVPQVLHSRQNPCNVRHAEAINFSLQNAGFDHDGVVVIIDSDMFLVRPLDVEKYMKNADIASFISHGLGTDGIPYLCPCLVFLNMPNLPKKTSLDFSVGYINGVLTDSGGLTHHYITKNKNLRLNEISRLGSGELFCNHSIWGNYTDLDAPVNIKIEKYTQLGFTQNEIQFLLKKPDTFEYYLGLNFLHYRAGSNYDNKSQEYHYAKTQLFDEYLNSIMQS